MLFVEIIDINSRPTINIIIINCNDWHETVTICESWVELSKV